VGGRAGTVEEGCLGLEVGVICGAVGDREETWLTGATGMVGREASTPEGGAAGGEVTGCVMGLAGCAEGPPLPPKGGGGVGGLARRSGAVSSSSGGASGSGVSILSSVSGDTSTAEASDMGRSTG